MKLPRIAVATGALCRMASATGTRPRAMTRSFSASTRKTISVARSVWSRNAVCSDVEAVGGSCCSPGPPLAVCDDSSVIAAPSPTLAYGLLRSEGQLGGSMSEGLGRNSKEGNSDKLGGHLGDCPAPRRQTPVRPLPPATRQVLRALGRGQFV